MNELNNTNTTDIIQSSEQKPLYVANRSSQRFFFKKHKKCPLSEKGAPKPSYRNPKALSLYVTRGGRISPRRITGLCAKKAREVCRNIKIARFLAIMYF